MSAEIDALHERIRKMTRINAALMSRVERSMDHQLNGFSLFETAIAPDKQMRERTTQLQQTLRSLEISNRDLMRAKLEAEAANLSKTTFLASLSHDLLQPLNAARLAASTLHEVEMAADGAGPLFQVERALATLEELIRTLLDISKLEAGALDPEPRDVRSTAILQPLIEEFGPIAHKRGLALRLRPHEAVLFTDPLMLRRIVQNLLSNALRYTRRGGVILGCRAIGDHVRIEVVDTGPGIPPERREAIFEEFRRYDTAADGQVGFGLGLAIVRRLARTLNHPIGLRSKPGLGTVFSVTVPRGRHAPDPEPERPRLSSAGFDFFGSRLLLIENEPAGAQAMCELLRRWGCDVLAAVSAEEALQRLAQSAGRVDLVISDLHLNDGARGYDAIAAVRAALGAPTPAFIITADHSQKAASEIAARGLEMLKKPVKPAELRALVAYLLG